MKKPRMTRAEKALENRRRLLHAAAETVGEYGYGDASIARIVERAGLAQGTFYLYFESRQDLFDKLLPEVGNEALAFIRAQVGTAPDFLTMEERGMRAFFDYVLRNPSYFRIFTEAQAAAPRAYAEYTANRTGRFLDRITAAWRRGEVAGYSERELGVLTQVMLAARVYLYHQYADGPDGKGAVPDWVIQAYLRFVRRGLGAESAGEAAAGGDSAAAQPDQIGEIGRKRG
ncbi:MAG: TetR/AcrR family transcriptional regulator [Sneathiellaceae bacterium]